MKPAHVVLKPGADLDGFKTAARWLAAQGVPPRGVTWTTVEQEMLLATPAPPPGEAPPLSLPRAIGELIELAVCHSDLEHFALL